MKLISQNNNISIYNSVFEYIDSNMYIMIENNKALIIDPHQNDEVYNLLHMNNIIDITVLLSHEHPDHISGLKWLKDNFNTTIISTKETSDYIGISASCHAAWAGTWTFDGSHQDKKSSGTLPDYKLFDFSGAWNTGHRAALHRIFRTADDF